jgi:hypothetical protein
VATFAIFCAELQELLYFAVDPRKIDSDVVAYYMDFIG